MAFTCDAISFAITTGTRMSVPLAVTPCASSVPSGSSTVLIFAGTHSQNSIQLMRSISRVVGLVRLIALMPILEQSPVTQKKVFVVRTIVGHADIWIRIEHLIRQKRF